MVKEVVIVIPGIMASRLFLDGEEIWPPRPQETVFGYHRTEALRSADVTVGGMVDSVLSYQFYSTLKALLADLGFGTGLADRQLVEFPYDWRKDILGTAELLAARIEALHAAGTTVIHLVGHSMGGLVARLVTEAPQYQTRPWFESVKNLLALGTPHLGAPLAFARAMGLDGALGIAPEDFAELSRDPRYPSGYQLFPPPSEQAIWNMDDSALMPLDPYDDATAVALGLDPNQMRHARAVHDILGAGRKPPGVRYFYFAGTGHRTVTRLNVRLGPNGLDRAASVLTRTPDGGDGTVPIYSALPHLGQRQIVVNEHSTVFEGQPFRRVFVRLLGGNEGPALESTVVREMAEAGPKVSLSVDAPVQAVGRPVEVVLSVVGDAEDMAARVERIAGELTIDAVTEEGRLRERALRRHPIRYEGLPTNRLSLLVPSLEAGLYSIRFEGEPGDTGRASFAVLGGKAG